MKRIVCRATALWLLILLLFGGIGIFFRDYVKLAQQWALHTANPHLYAGNGRLAMGSVVDRQGIFLLRLNDGRTYTPYAPLRCAMLHWLGDREGNIRPVALENYAAQLSGFSLHNGLYGYGGGGATATLTLSARVQAVALEALGEHHGTVAVYNYQTGELLCAVSSPTFDVDAMPDLSSGDYEGVYLNRFTQATYVPGSIFKLVTTAAALEAMGNARDYRYTCSGRYVVGNDQVTCERAHGSQTLASAMANSCNCCYADLTMHLGRDVLQAYVQNCGVLERVQFDGITTAKGNFSVSEASAVEIAWSGIGQHKDLINPCAFLMFVGAIANGGQAAVPYAVSSVQRGNSVRYQAMPVLGVRVMRSETAQVLQDLMKNNVLEKYGREHFPDGMTVCAKSGTGEVGGGRASHAMFVGFVAEDAYPVAFFVAVENAGYGQTVGVPIVAQVLAECKRVQDGSAP